MGAPPIKKGKGEVSRNWSALFFSNVSFTIKICKKDHFLDLRVPYLFPYFLYKGEERRGAHFFLFLHRVCKKIVWWERKIIWSALFSLFSYSLLKVKIGAHFFLLLHMLCFTYVPQFYPRSESIIIPVLKYEDSINIRTQFEVDHLLISHCVV